MSNKTEPKKMTIKNFFKILFIANNVSDAEVADKIGTTRQNVNTLINRGRMNLGSFVDMLEACGETFIIELKNGETFELEIKAKDNERNK